VSGQPLSGSAGQPGSSSAQGQDKDGEDSSLEDEDTIEVLEEGESLELVQFDPTVKDSKKWDAGETIKKFLEKHFARTLDEKELGQIMEDFPKPDCSALCTPKLDEEVKRLIQQAGKDPHFGTETHYIGYKTKYSTWQALSLACGLTYLINSPRSHQNK